MARQRRASINIVVLLSICICICVRRGVAAESVSGPGRSRKNPDIVLLLVDALRADHLSLYGYSRATTPRLIRRRTELRWFTNAVAESTQTASSVASLFTGVPPMQHGIEYDTIGTYFPPYGAFPLLDTPLPTLAETLKKAGYETRALVGNPWISTRTRFDRGFAKFDGWKVWESTKTASDEELAPLTNDAALLDAAAAWLEQPRSAPRFAYAHLMTVHNPYDKGRYRFVRVKGNVTYVNGPAKPSPHDLQFMIDLYDSNVAYTDRLIGAFLDRIGRRKSRRPTVVCIVADHGEEFLEHGGLGHGTTVYNELARVPVIFWGPRVITRSGPSLYPLALTDVRSVLVALARGEIGATGLVSTAVPPPRSPAGRTRVVELNNDKAIMESPWKYMVTKSPFVERLFNLKNDPRERYNLAAKEASRLRHFRRLAKRFWPDFPYPSDARAGEKCLPPRSYEKCVGSLPGHQ